MTRAAIALGMSVAFIFPTLSWAFEIKAEPKPDKAPAEIAFGVDPALARDFNVPARFGRIIHAEPATGKLTLLLVQDLHCNLEVQNNIRNILSGWRRRHPALGLVTVEGATGIIPTLELASLPETPAKQAVVNYFLREGKLTGADALAITTRPALELYGAEDPDLYDRSLALISQFATDENRGLVYELMDQVRFLRSRRYNPNLLAFEQRRDAVLNGRLDADEYHRLLLQEARSRNVPLLPAGVASWSRSGTWDFQDRVSQDQYLENAIRETLYTTDQERRFYRSQRFVELVEQLLTVSLSQSEVYEFRSLRSQLSLSGIQKGIQAELRRLEYVAGLDPRFSAAVAALEPALDQGLEFYRLAEERNTALFRRTVDRARERKDNLVVLVTGGYHAQAIGTLARQQGLGCVCVRPAQAQPETANHYFQLLRDPDLPTELERLLAQVPRRGAAIAVRNFLVTHGARLREAVDAAQEAWNVLRGGPSAGTDQVVRVTPTTARFMPRGGRPFFLTFLRGNDEIEINERSPRGALAHPGVRIAGLVLLAAGSGALVLTGVFTGSALVVSGALLSVGALAVGIGLLLVGLWALNAPSVVGSSRRLRQNLVLALSALPFLGQGPSGIPVFSDLMIRFSGTRVPALGHLRGLLTAIRALLRLVPQDRLRLQTRPAAELGTTFAAFGTVAAAVTGPLAMPMGLAMAAFGAPGKNDALARHAPEVNPADRVGSLAREEEADKIRAVLGYQVKPGDNLEDTVGFYSPEALEQAERTWNLVGLEKYARDVELQQYLTTLSLDEPLLIVSAPAMAVFTPTGRTRSKLHIGLQLYQLLRNGEVVRGLQASPAEVDTAITRNLDPSAVASANTAKIYQGLQKLPKDIMTQIAGFLDPVIQAMQSLWKQIFAGLTAEEIQDLRQNIMAHELAHGVMAHLPPDVIDPEITDTEAIKVYQSITIKSFWELFWNTPELRNNILFFRCVAKGLMSIAKTIIAREADKDQAFEIFKTVTIVEYLCDRFGSMFVRETAAKVGALQKVYPRANVDDLLRVETARRAASQAQRDPRAAEEAELAAIKAALREFTPATLVIDARVLSELRRNLVAAESANVYLTSFGQEKFRRLGLQRYWVPPLSPAERDKFLVLLNFLKGLETSTGLLNWPSEYHRQRSSAYQVSVVTGQLGEAGAMAYGIAGVVTEAMAAVAQGVSPAAALIQTAAESLVQGTQEQPVVLADPIQVAVEGEQTGGGLSFLAMLNDPAAAEKSLAEAEPVKPEYAVEMAAMGVTTQLAPGAEATGAAVEDGTAFSFLGALQSGLDAGALEEQQANPPSRTIPRAVIEAPAGKSTTPKGDQRTGQPTSRMAAFGSRSVAGETTAVSFGAGETAGTMVGVAAQGSARAAVPTVMSPVGAGATSDQGQATLNWLFNLWNDQPIPTPPLPGADAPFIVWGSPSLAGLFGSGLLDEERRRHQGDERRLQFLNTLRFEPLTLTGPNSYQGVQGSGKNGLVVLSQPTNTYVPGTERLTGADGRVTADRAADLLNRLLDLYAGQPGPITLQIGDPVLLAAFQAYLSALGPSNPQAAALAQALTYTTPGTRPGAGQSVAVFTPRNPAPVSVTDGRVSVGAQFIAVPASVDLPGDASAMSIQNLASLSNAAAFAGFYLLTRDQARQLGLRNFADDPSRIVTGMVTNQNPDIQRWVNRLQQAVPAAFAPGQTVTLWYDEPLMAQKQASVADYQVTYGAESADVFAKIWSLMASALAGETPVQGRVTGAGVLTLGTLEEAQTKAALFNVGALRAAETAATDAWNTTTLSDPEMRAALKSVTGSDEPTPDALAALRDALRNGLMDEQAVVVESRAAGSTALEHELRKDVQAVLVAYTAPGSRNAPERLGPAQNTGEVRALDPTQEVQVEGQARGFSPFILGLLASRLVGRLFPSLVASLARGSRHIQDIPLFSVILPTFVRALRIMAAIVMGRFGAKQVVDSTLRAQINELLRLELQLKGRDLETLGATDVPAILQGAMPQLLWLRRILRNPLFTALLRLLGVDLNDMNVQYLLLLDQFFAMDAVRWYLSSGSYLRSVIRDQRSGLDGAVRAALDGSPRLQRALDRLDVTPSQRLVRNLIWQLLSQLNAKNVSPAERKAFQLGILKVLSRVDPAHQTQLWVQFDDQSQELVSIPTLVLTTPQLLRGLYPHFPLYFNNQSRDKVPEPKRNMILSVVQAA